VYKAGTSKKVTYDLSRRYKDIKLHGFTIPYRSNIQDIMEEVKKDPNFNKGHQ